nr:hypothetical protein [Tanacetum cinerariifolium]
MTMDTKIDQQVAMDEALVLHAQRLKIGRSNFHFLSDIKSKESTLQFVYDVLRLCPFFKAFLVIADVPEVEQKNSKKSNEIYYPRFTKVIIHHFMSKDPSIPRRNKFGALLPIELTNEETRNSNAYQEYYAIATGAAPPKPNASVRRTRSSSDTTITPLTTAAGPRLTTSQKGKQAAKASKAKSLSALSEVAMTEAQQLKLVTKRSLQQTHISQASGSGADEGTGSIPGVPGVPTQESEEELSWNSTDDEGDDEGKNGDDDNGDDGEEGGGDDDDEDDDGKEGDDDDDQEAERDDDKDDKVEGGNDKQEYDEEEYDEETRDEESLDPILKTPKNSDDEGNGEEVLRLNVGREEGHDEEEVEDELYKDVNINQGRGIQANLEVEDSHVTLTLVNPDDSNLSGPCSYDCTTMTPSAIATITTTSQAPILPTTTLSTIIQNLPNFNLLFGFDNRLRTLEANFYEFMQTNQFAGAVSAIPKIIQRYMDQRMSEAVQVSVPLQFDKLREEAQKENDEFLKTIDENMQNIIKEQVKEQVKAISLSNALMNKGAFVDAYKSDKIILDTYGETVTLKRRRDDDADKDEEPSARPDRGSKRRKEGKEHESASAPIETATRSADRSTQGTRSRQMSFYGFAINREFARDVYSKRRIIAVTELKIVEWNNYKHLDWITVRRDDDKVYKFKEGDFKRLRIKDINDMLLLLVQGKLTNLTVEERFAFNVSLRMFTRSIVIQRHVEDLQLGVERYQKKLNLTELDSYRSDLKHKEAYTAYSNLQGFIYQNKEKKNRLMRIDELHKFNVGTLIDVRIALDDRLKGIQMQYLPQLIWRKSDKDRAAAMIQANDKRLKTKRIMRSLERFVGGRLYEGRLQDATKDHMIYRINLFLPLDNLELTIRRRSLADPTLLNDFEMATEGNDDPPVPDLKTMEELCQPSLNGRGGPIAPIAI